MRTIKNIIILSLSIFVVVNFASCGGGKSKQQIENEINDLHGRIRVLNREIPRERKAGNLNRAEQMENNLRNYQIQLDELNRQLVK